MDIPEFGIQPALPHTCKWVAPPPRISFFSGLKRRNFSMKTMLSFRTLSVFSILLLSLGNSAWAQQIFRCSAVNGSAPEYINNVKEAQSRGCKAVSGGNVTVVQGAPVSRAPARAASGSGSGSARLEGSPDQRARDSDSRIILEAELRKSESRLAEQQKEYNNGEPEKQGIEGRNYQRYLDRTSDLKDGIARSQSDIAGLKREISRLPVAN